MRSFLRPVFLAPAVLALVLSAATLPARGQDAPTQEIRLYGFMLLNAAYNVDAPTPIDVPIQATPGEEGSFLMTARQSRLGVRATHSGALRATGVIELDLWGLMGSAAPGGPTQSAPRTRLAYFTLALDETSELLFGQYWTVLAPLNPTSLAHVSVPPLTSSGNLWNRIPQIRYSYTGGPASFQVALLRPFAGENTPTVSQSDYASIGEYSRLPFAQARVAFAADALTVGLGGHLGRVDLRTPQDEDDEATTYAVAADVALKAGMLQLSGEAFVAENNRSLFGLAGTVIDEDRRASGDGSVGGWGQLSYQVDPRTGLNVGYGLEHNDETIDNRTFFVNGIFNVPGAPVSFALEYTHIWTDLPDRDAYLSRTVNFAAQYRFGM